MALLMGTAQFGVMRFANGVWSALEATATQRLRVLSLARVGDGALWIGTEDSAWRLAADGELVDAATLGLPQGAIYALLDLGAEGVLVGGDTGPFLWRDGAIHRYGEDLDIGHMHVRACCCAAMAVWCWVATMARWKWMRRARPYVKSSMRGWSRCWKTATGCSGWAPRPTACSATTRAAPTSSTSVWACMGAAARH